MSGPETIGAATSIFRADSSATVDGGSCELPLFEGYFDAAEHGADPLAGELPERGEGQMTVNDKEPSVDLLREKLTGAAEPRDVFLAAGDWMAHRFGERGYRWLTSRGRLSRGKDGRTEEIVMEPSRCNRAGGYISFAVVRLTVFDDELARWRRAHVDMTVERPRSMRAIVCASSFLDFGVQHTAIVTDPDRRIAEVDALCDTLTLVAMPWFQTTDDIGRLITDVPDSLLQPWAFGQDLLELLISRGSIDAARLLIERFPASGDRHRAAFAAGVELAAKKAVPRWHAQEAFG